MKRILVTGSTGNVGREVVAQLLARDVSVRAMTRRPEAAGFSAQVEVVRGDLGAPDSLDGCLKDVDTVFLLWTAPSQDAGPVIERITKRVGRVVFLSSPHKTPHPFFQQPNGLRLLQANIERLIEASGCEWTFVRPGIFSANSKMWWAGQIQSSEVVRWPYVDVQTAPIDEHDIAAVAVHAMCESGHGHKEYVATGPQSLSQREQILIVGEVLGRKLRVQEITPDEARRELPMTLPVANMLLGAWAAAAGQPAFVASTVAEVTGTPARTFLEWATNHAAEFRAG